MCFLNSFDIWSYSMVWRFVDKIGRFVSRTWLEQNHFFSGIAETCSRKEFCTKGGNLSKKPKNNRNTTHMHSAIVSVQPICFETQGQVLTLTVPWNLKTPSNTTGIDSPNLELYGYIYICIYIYIAYRIVYICVLFIQLFIYLFIHVSFWCIYIYPILWIPVFESLRPSVKRTPPRQSRQLLPFLGVGAQESDATFKKSPEKTFKVGDVVSGEVSYIDSWRWALALLEFSRGYSTC